MTTFKQLQDEIHAFEGRLAYGSETSIYGSFVDRMFTIGGKHWRESDAEVPADEVDWWHKAYELYEADQALPLDEQATDVQDIFDRV